MLFRNFLLVVFLVGFGGNVYAFLNAVDIEEVNLCKNDTWNDSWDGKVNIKNICNIKIFDKETAEAIMAKLENLDLNKPVRTAVEGAIQGFKKELEGNLKPLFDELKSLLKEGTDQADKLIEGVDKRLEKRLAQIADEIRKTVKSFREDVVAIIEQTEKSVINVIKGAEDSIKGVTKQTEESIARLLDDMVTDLNSMAASLNTELSKKFETIRTAIKTDIMFIGDYLSCKGYGVEKTLKEDAIDLIGRLPFIEGKKKFCQDCSSGLFCSLNKYFCSPERIYNECKCCEKTKLNTGESPMKLFRYYVCMRKHDVDGNSQIHNKNGSIEYSVIDVYTDINEKTKEVYCKSDMTKGGKNNRLQARMIKEAEQAYKEELFWQNVSK